LAVSWGKGDPQKDHITLVFLDEAGRLREHTRIDNLNDPEHQDEFRNLVRRRKPDVIAIGGFSVATTRLSSQIKETLHLTRGEDGAFVSPSEAQEFSRIVLTFVFDEVARKYQHSNRVGDEFAAFSPIIKYCIGLARYLQNPLNEYAALGSNITAITLEEEYQHLIPTEKLLTALERGLVDCVNRIGVDINRAVTDPYYQYLLTYVCGLGPRKAHALVKKIGSLVSPSAQPCILILCADILLGGKPYKSGSIRKGFLIDDEDILKCSRLPSHPTRGIFFQAIQVKEHRRL
jgi:transcription elongation factor SPT6